MVPSPWILVPFLGSGFLPYGRSGTSMRSLTMSSSSFSSSVRWAQTATLSFSVSMISHIRRNLRFPCASRSSLSTSSMPGSSSAESYWDPSSGALEDSPSNAASQSATHAALRRGSFLGVLQIGSPAQWPNSWQSQHSILE